MLRQLMLQRKLGTARDALATLADEEQALATQGVELEAAIEEAETEEELEAVAEAVAELEGEQKSVDEKKSKLESEIAELEGELEELKSNEPAAPAATPEGRAAQSRGGDSQVKMKRGFFRGMTRASAEAIVSRGEVKEFIERVRGMIGAKRSVSGADLLVPDVLLELLRDTLHRYSKLVGRVGLRPVSGTARQTIIGAIPEGIWTEMVGTLNELDIVFNQLEVDGYKVGGFISVPNSTMEDSDLNLASEVLDAIGQAIGLALDKAIIYGKGTKMPVGIVTRLAEEARPGYWGNRERNWTDLRATHLLKVSETDSAEAFFADLLLKLGVVEANYSDGNLFWATSTSTFRVLQSKALMFNAAGAIVSGMQNTMPVIGGDVELLDFIPNGHIIGGYGSLYLLAERAGATFASSEHAQFIQDNTVFRGTARYDGRPVFGEAFVGVTIDHDGDVPGPGDVSFPPDEANTENP